MPLIRGSDKKTISRNISEFHGGKTYNHTAAKFGKERANKQAIAVALHSAREYGRKYADGGSVDDPYLAERKALRDTVAGSESKGYNYIYGGSRFDDYSDHPRRYVPIVNGPNVGRTTSAAGRYQFLGSSWDEAQRALKLPDFSPESQDKAFDWAAARQYKSKTGGDLWKDLAAAKGDQDQIHNIGRGLSGWWTSLPGGLEPNSMTNSFANRYMKAYGSSAPESDQSTSVGYTQDNPVPAGMIGDAQRKLAKIRGAPDVPAEPAAAPAPRARQRDPASLDTLTPTDRDAMPGLLPDNRGGSEDMISLDSFSARQGDKDSAHGLLPDDYAKGGKVDRKHDIPYLAGISRNNKCLYIDRRLPKTLTVKGRTFDPAKYLRVHESHEHKVMTKQGISYENAHKQATNREKAAVEADGIDWRGYQTEMHRFARKTEHEKHARKPLDLYLGPYKSKAEGGPVLKRTADDLPYYQADDNGPGEPEKAPEKQNVMTDPTLLRDDQTEADLPQLEPAGGSEREGGLMQNIPKAFQMLTSPEGRGQIENGIRNWWLNADPDNPDSYKERSTTERAFDSPVLRPIKGMLETPKKVWDEGGDVPLGEQADYAAGTALGLIGQGAVGSMARPANNSLGIFTSKGSSRSHLQDYARGEEMLKAGAAPAEIHKQTGLEVFQNGKLGHEISDYDANLDPKFFRPVKGKYNYDDKSFNRFGGLNKEGDIMGLPPGVTIPLWKVWPHKELFAEEPWTANIMVKGKPFDPSSKAQGGWYKDFNTIELAPNHPIILKEILGHEVGHAVAEKRGLPTGSNPLWHRPHDYEGQIKAFDETRSDLGQYLKAVNLDINQWNIMNDYWAKHKDSANPMAKAPQNVRNTVDQIINLPLEVQDQLNALQTHIVNESKRLNAIGEKTHKDYLSVWGEANSRNTEYRMQLKPEEARQLSMRDTMHSMRNPVPIEEQIKAPERPSNTTRQKPPRDRREFDPKDRDELERLSEEYGMKEAWKFTDEELIDHLNEHGFAPKGSNTMPEKKARGGAADQWVMHQAARNLHQEGAIKSSVPGRTDKIPRSVPAGAYILPADSISQLGQNNSAAGAAIAKSMFSKGPMGMEPMKGGRSFPRPISTQPPRIPRQPRPQYADGGEAEGDDNVPVILAGGEFVIHPDVVRDIGHGSMKAGHKVLDKFVLKLRKKHIATLKSLKPPK